MMDREREQLEIGKMLINLLRENKDFKIEYVDGTLYINNKESYINHLYDELKIQYLASMGHEKTENMTFDLSPETYEMLCSEADKRGITIDEMVIEILKGYLE